LYNYKIMYIESQNVISGTYISNDNNNNNNESGLKIHRFNFQQEFIDELYKFSKIHQYDHRKDFKEAWEIWLETNDELVKEEIERLTILCYRGNILSKMYKSARYYFRKKSTEKKAPKPRNLYIGLEKQILDAIDLNITTLMKEPNFKPSVGFDNFCNNNIDLLKEEVKKLYREGLTSSDDIKKKIKKTYKNRCFILISKIK